MLRMCVHQPSFLLFLLLLTLIKNSLFIKKFFLRKYLKQNSAGNNQPFHVSISKQKKKKKNNRWILLLTNLMSICEF